MQKPRYALVAYLKNPAGEFVENLRRELHPDLPHLAAHLTILPPRPLQGAEDSALQVLERICGSEEPFEVTLGEVETFIPVTPTVYIRVDGAAAQMSELHSKLNAEALAFQEEWPYIPHLTIVKMSSEHGCADRLSDRARALGPLLGKPSHPAGKADLCPRRCAELLGRSGARAAGPPPGYALTSGNRHHVTRFSYSRRAPMALGTSPSRALKSRAHGCR